MELWIWAFVGGLVGTFVMDVGARGFAKLGVNDALGGLFLAAGWLDLPGSNLLLMVIKRWNPPKRFLNRVWALHFTIFSVEGEWHWFIQLGLPTQILHFQIIKLFQV